MAFVKGLQGDDPHYFKVIATPKHFIVHSGPEPLRHGFNAVTSERDFFESYLPAFRATVSEGGAYSVMGAYSAYKGVPCNASYYLLDTILRQQLGFKGYVVSDCGAVRDIMSGHKMAKSLEEASAMAVKAGCDLDCGTEYRTLAEAVKKGLITEKEIDISVKRLMKARFLLGMFDPPERVSYAQIPYSMNDTKEHRTLARKVARRSMVLLKNKNHLLPLSDKIKKIAVIGPYADNLDVLVGNYHGTPSHPVTFLQGIRDAAGDQIQVDYAEGVVPLEKFAIMTTVDAHFTRPSDTASSFGLKGEYFANPDLEGKPVFVRVDTIMRHYWDIHSPGKGIPEDHFSVRWSGVFVSPVTGPVELGIVTDDKGRLYFDGKLVVDNWDPFEVNKMKSFRITLKKGEKHTLRIEYADVTGHAGMRFQWRALEPDAENISMIREAVKKAREADVVILVTGISSRLEGEEMPVKLDGFEGGDRTRLVLPDPYENLLKAVYDAGKPVVLVLTGGSALAVNWAETYIPAILMAWYPGEEGGHALADILFGRFNPVGRLPVTFYRSVNDLPPFTDYFMKGRTYRYFSGFPLYPFGYGMSYTSFDYSDLSLSGKEVIPSDTVKIHLTVKNTGNMDGEELIQLYVRNLNQGEPQPLKSLKGFRHVYLKKGEKKQVTILLPVSELAYYHTKDKKFVTDPGKYEIQIGASSSDIRLKTKLYVKK